MPLLLPVLGRVLRSIQYREAVGSVVAVVGRGAQAFGVDGQTATGRDVVEAVGN